MKRLARRVVGRLRGMAAGAALSRWGEYVVESKRLVRDTELGGEGGRWRCWGGREEGGDWFADNCWVDFVSFM